MSPSLSAARAAVTKEVRLGYKKLGVAPISVSCERLTSTLFKCRWHGRRAGVAAWEGTARVHFLTYSADVTLASVVCSNASTAVDNCHGGKPLRFGSEQEAVAAAKEQVMRAIPLLGAGLRVGSNASFSAGCDRVSAILFDCSWEGKWATFASWQGDALVTFHESGTTTVLSNVKCYSETIINDCQ